jgi:phage terminase Nu1 subunit (DNA packaging protein)
MKTREVTLDTLAQILGKSRHYVLDRLRMGMPYLEKGGRGRSYILDYEQAAAWCAEHDAGMARKPVDGATVEARRRHQMAQAELAELRLAQKREELVPVDAVRAQWADECVRIRSRLMEIPGRLAGQLAILQNAGEIEAAIDAEVRAALTELSA